MPKTSGPSANKELAPVSRAKWPTPEMRRDVFANLCAHLADGYSMRSWPLGGENTIAYYLSAYPEDWPREAFETAWRQGMQKWEALGLIGVGGGAQKFNAPAWMFVMKHRYGWRDDTTMPGDAAMEKGRFGEESDDDQGTQGAVIVVPGVMTQDEWQAGVRNMLARRKESGT